MDERGIRIPFSEKHTISLYHGVHIASLMELIPRGVKRTLTSSLCVSMARYFKMVAKICGHGNEPPEPTNGGKLA
jgi:hypothetical protein